MPDDFITFIPPLVGESGQDLDPKRNNFYGASEAAEPMSEARVAAPLPKPQTEMAEQMSETNLVLEKNGRT